MIFDDKVVETSGTRVDNVLKTNAKHRAGSGRGIVLFKKEQEKKRYSDLDAFGPSLAWRTLTHIGYMQP